MGKYFSYFESINNFSDMYKEFVNSYSNLEEELVKEYKDKVKYFGNDKNIRHKYSVESINVLKQIIQGKNTYKEIIGVIGDEFDAELLIFYMIYSELIEVCYKGQWIDKILDHQLYVARKSLDLEENLHNAILINQYRSIFKIYSAFRCDDIIFTTTDYGESFYNRVELKGIMDNIKKSQLELDQKINDISTKQIEAQDKFIELDTKFNKINNTIDAFYTRFLEIMAIMIAIFSMIGINIGTISNLLTEPHNMNMTLYNMFIILIVNLSLVLIIAITIYLLKLVVPSSSVDITSKKNLKNIIYFISKSIIVIILLMVIGINFELIFNTINNFLSNTVNL